MKWLTDYLSGRSQFVVVSGAKSLPSPVLSGVPQGSILGPLLFLIYIDDLSHVNLLSSPRLHMFADDVLLYQVIDSVKDFVSVQENINTIWEWSQQNALTLNPTKCKFMMISRKKNSLLPPAPLHLGGRLLECVNSYKYLGVHLSSDLSWSNHTQHVCVKAKKLIGLIYRNFYNHIPQNMLLKLYKSLVRPHLEYAAAIWCPHLQCDKKLLERVEKFALRMVTKCWDLSYLELLDITGVLSLERRRDVARLCLLYKIVNCLCFFDLNVFSSCTSRSYHSHPLALTQPLSHTNSFYNSYVPATIRLWNNLDSITCSAPSYFSFKQQLISIQV